MYPGKFLKFDPGAQDGGNQVIPQLQHQGLASHRPRRSRRSKPSSATSKAEREELGIKSVYSVYDQTERVLDLVLKAARRRRTQGAGIHRQSAGRIAGNHHRQAELQVGRRELHGRPALQRAAHAASPPRNSRRSATKSRASCRASRASRPCAPRRARATRKCRSWSIASAPPRSASPPLTSRRPWPPACAAIACASSAAPSASSRCAWRSANQTGRPSTTWPSFPSTCPAARACRCRRWRTSASRAARAPSNASIG